MSREKNHSLIFLSCMEYCDSNSDLLELICYVDLPPENWTVNY